MEKLDYVRTREAAAYCCLSPETLRRLRRSGRGPKWSRAGQRIVVYRIEALDQWLLSLGAGNSEESGSEQKNV